MERDRERELNARQQKGRELHGGPPALIAIDYCARGRSASRVGRSSLPSPAAGFVPDRRILRRRDGRVVPAARPIPRRGSHHAAHGLFLAAVLVPAQLFFGHLVGDYVHDKQPAKFAAIEGRWHTEQPASEVLIALPDEAAETNRHAISVPILGSLIGSMSFTSKEVGLGDFPVQDRPPVAIPFFAFRIMVGCGLLMRNAK